MVKEILEMWLREVYENREMVVDYLGQGSLKVERGGNSKKEGAVRQRVQMAH